MTALDLNDLIVDLDGHGQRTVFDNRDPKRPVPLTDAQMVELLARLIGWSKMITAMVED
jgi:hypothetical protein